MRSSVLLALALPIVAGCDRRTPLDLASALTVAVRADVTGVFPNPPMTNDSYSLDISSNVFEGLVRLDGQLVPQPAIATRWENPDAQTWIFHLRPGVRFSTGAPLTADDVVASLVASKQRGWCNAGALQSVETVSAPDPATVRIQTRGPSPNLLARLHYGFVLPAAALASSPVPAIGTGPYVVEAWRPGDELALARNPAFRGPTPGFERIRFEVVSDDEQRVRRLVEDRAQMIDTVPLSVLGRLEADPGVRIVSAPGLRVVYLAFRVGEPPFADPRVREAVDLAIDRGEVVRRALYGRASPASQLVTSAVAGFNPAIAAPSLDREGSRRLLAEAGFKQGFAARLEGPAGWYVEDVAILHEVARQLAEVGIRAEVHAVPKRDWVPVVTAGQSRFFLFGWACETRDAGDALDALAHSPTPEGLGRNNYQGLADAELDRLIDQANLEPDTRLRTRLFSKALGRLAEIHAIVPLAIQPETMAIRKRLSWQPPLNFGLRLLETARPAPLGGRAQGPDAGAGS